MPPATAHSTASISSRAALGSAANEILVPRAIARKLSDIHRRPLRLEASSIGRCPGTGSSAWRRQGRSAPSKSEASCSRACRAAAGLAIGSHRDTAPSSKRVHATAADACLSPCCHLEAQWSVTASNCRRQKEAGREPR